MNATLTTGNVGSQLIRLALPMVWGIFAVIAFSLADTYFVAQLGTQELAAMSFTFPVVMVLSNISMGLGTGVSSVIARGIGEGNRDHIQRLTTDSLILSLLIVLIVAIVGVSTINPLFTALGADATVLPLIWDYMNIWYLGMIFLVIPIVGNSAIRASGNAAVPSLIMTVAAVVNVGLDPVLIFGWGDVPALGIKGAALATVISRAVTLIASLAFLHYREQLLVFRQPKLHQMWTNWKRILAVALPVAGTNLISPISTALSTGLIAYYGAEAVAGFGIASRIEAFALIIPIALSASIGPFVGQNWGAKHYSRIKRALQIAVSISLGWGMLIAILVGTYAPGIAVFFDNEPAVIQSVAAYLSIVPLSYGALGIVLVYCSTFNALGQPLPSVAVTLSRLIIFYVPLAYLGSWVFGIRGIFAAACLSNVAIGLGVWFWQSHRDNSQEKSPSAQLKPASEAIAK